MKLLGFDLSTQRGTIALVNGDNVLCSRDWPNDRRNSAPFFTVLNEIIREHVARRRFTQRFGLGAFERDNFLRHQLFFLGRWRRLFLLGLGRLFLFS